jgi:hypothetical protein
MDLSTSEEDESEESGESRIFWPEEYIPTFWPARAWDSPTEKLSERRSQQLEERLADADGLLPRQTDSDHPRRPARSEQRSPPAVSERSVMLVRFSKLDLSSDDVEERTDFNI